MKNLPLFASAILATVSIIAACSSSSSHPPIAGGGATSSGGVTAPGNGSALDGGLSTTDGGACIAGTFDVDIDTQLLGTNQIAGSVSFSTTVAAGHAIAITLTSMSGSPTFTNSFTFPVAKDSFTFNLLSIPDGTYTLQAQADVTGTTGVNDTGDLDGYYGGTTLSPVHVRADGELITVPGCKGGSDFGIGPKM